MILAGFRRDAKQGVFAGISSYQYRGFLSLWAGKRFCGDFGRLVSASQNSVPGRWF